MQQPVSCPDFEGPPTPEKDQRQQRRQARWLWLAVAVVAACLKIAFIWAAVDGFGRGHGGWVCEAALGAEVGGCPAWGKASFWRSRGA